MPVGVNGYMIIHVMLTSVCCLFTKEKMENY
jgi:hypothetical protein